MKCITQVWEVLEWKDAQTSQSDAEYCFHFLCPHQRMRPLRKVVLAKIVLLFLSSSIFLSIPRLIARLILRLTTSSSSLMAIALDSLS